MTDMTTQAKRHRPGLAGLLAIATLAAVAACSGAVPPVPTAQSVAGLTPAGYVQLTENFVSGAGAGRGTLDFHGQMHPFDLVGTIVGGLGLERIQASGEVYRLTTVGDFAGPYSQGTGAPGLNTSSTGDLWLQNKAGVILHLRGSQSGGALSLGRDEIYIKLTN